MKSNNFLKISFCVIITGVVIYVVAVNRGLISGPNALNTGISIESSTVKADGSNYYRCSRACLSKLKSCQKTRAGCVRDMEKCMEYCAAGPNE